MTFYDSWLGLWDEAEAARKASRKLIHADELDWTPTRQDHLAALLIAPETGFRTMGTSTMLAEIPPEGHTGEHKHGEEVSYILTGSGCSLVDGVRYDWGPGSVLAIPFGARHQHFNIGGDTVRYFSALSVQLEHFAGLHRTVQYAPKGAAGPVPAAESSADGRDPTGRRIVLTESPGPTPETGPAAVPAPDDDAEHRAMQRSFLAGNTLVVGDVTGFGRFAHLHRTERNTTRFMRVGQERNQFTVHEQEISAVLRDPAGEYSGKHAHQEALLYILRGRGHSGIDGQTVHWRPGSALHIPGPQTVHQHFVDGSGDSAMLRVAGGLRYFFEPVVRTEWPYLFLSPRQALAEGNR